MTAIYAIYGIIWMIALCCSYKDLIRLQVSGEERESFLRSSLMDQVSGEERESFLRSSLID